MDKKIYLLFGIPLLAFALIFASSIANDNQPFVEKPMYSANVEVIHMRDGQILSSQTSHNLLTEAGANALKLAIGFGNDFGVFHFIGLSNATAGSTIPVATDTGLDNELDASAGLNRTAGTYSDYGQGAFSIFHTFTSDTAVTINTTGLFNQTASSANAAIMLAINNFTDVNMQSADLVSLNWTINITDGS